MHCRTAGAWLSALPSDDDLEMHHGLFQVALKRRLRMRIFAEDCFCASCGSTMDRFGDHALVCSCKGDRTVRHNKLRNEVHKEAMRAGMMPEKEKPGLLPRRPESDGISTAVDHERRRPADVWLPRGTPNGGQALDFACTSGLRADIMETTEMQAPAVFAEYETHKRNYKETDRVCQSQGFTFTPVIFEAQSGAWSPSARKIFSDMAQKIASTSSSYATPDSESLRFAQRLAITLQRENARAIVRRFAGPAPAEYGNVGWDTWID